MTAQAPEAISYRDRPITTLTREELLDALVHAYNRLGQLKDEREAQRATR